MSSDLPSMAAVVTKHVILDEQDANGMRPFVVEHPTLPMGLRRRAMVVRADTRIRGERC